MHRAELPNSIKKNAKVVPFPKTNDLSDPSNYRPISLLRVISKPLERHIHTDIYSSFTHPPVLSALLPILSESTFYVPDFPLVVPELFLSSTPLLGLTFPFLSKRNSLWISSNSTSKHFFLQSKISPLVPLSIKLFKLVS